MSAESDTKLLCGNLFQQIPDRNLSFRKFGLCLSGTTPQRREFNYPRSLVQTRQHDVILEEFRTKYFANEAQNTSLPSDSEFFSETPQVCNVQMILFGFHGIDTTTVEVVDRGSQHLG